MTHALVQGTPAVGPVRLPSRGPLELALAAVRLWHERVAMRQRLAALDDRLLADIGIDRDAARREASKPFWRA